MSDDTVTLNNGIKMKRFRYLSTTYTIKRLYTEHSFMDCEKQDIEAMDIGDSIAYVPGSSCKAYQMTRIK